MQPVLDQFKKELPKSIHYNQSFNNAESVRKSLGILPATLLSLSFVSVNLAAIGFQGKASGNDLHSFIACHWFVSTGYLGFTINQLSIVGFVVALGLLVDDRLLWLKILNVICVWVIPDEKQQWLPQNRLAWLY